MFADTERFQRSAMARIILQLVSKPSDPFRGYLSCRYSNRRNRVLRLVTAMLTVTFVLSFTIEAQAQLFGNRRSARSQARRRAGAGSAAGTGTMQGNERFVRGNRGRNSFVGSDTGDVRRFVGSEQATTTGRILSTTTGLRSEQDPSARINQPFPQSAGNARYYPKLVLDFDLATEANRNSSAEISGRLEESESLQQLGVIAVSVVDGKATLRGEVPSESDRKLAEILVGFEPGIVVVQNDLSVNLDLRFPPPPVPPLPSN